MEFLNCILKILKYFVMTAVTVLTGVFPYGFSVSESRADFEIKLNERSGTASNIMSNVNCWNMGTSFIGAEPNGKYNVFDFVEYVQLMQCSGGNEYRDLFLDPDDRSVLDDYDFERLIGNCEGIISLGAKPHLKLGSVPEKYTTGPERGEFDTNRLPPDDYDVYYDYIFALANALVENFGKDEVLTWRFGVMTEFENESWFKARSGDPDESREAYCKLYDYTVQALIDAVGPDVFVGAHAMAVTDGLWKEEDFIEHVACGTNYKTGKTGTKICFLSASFYDNHIGSYTSGNTLEKTIGHLRECAKKYGLNDLIYGVDEGRILCGTVSGSIGNQLLSRTTGYTWQAAYDARLWKKCIDNNIDYFSSWSFLTGGLIQGYPTVSYHVAKNISAFGGSEKVKVKKNVFKAADFGVEIDSCAVYNPETQTLRIMAYNYKNSLELDKKAKLSFKVDASQFGLSKVIVKKTFINDDCNFFDEWCKDRKTYGITDDCFGWSPEDPWIEDRNTLSDDRAVSIYETELKEKYEECAQSRTIKQVIEISDGELLIKDTIDPNSVVFYEINLGK